MFHDDVKPVSFFSYLTNTHAHLIKSHSRKMSFPKGAVILQQDERSFDVYIILNGRVRVSLLNEDGKEIVLDILNEGDFFGEMSFLDNRSRSAMVTAMTDATILFIEKGEFLKLLRANSDIRSAFFPQWQAGSGRQMRPSRPLPFWMSPDVWLGCSWILPKRAASKQPMVL